MIHSNLETEGQDLLKTKTVEINKNKGSTRSINFNSVKHSVSMLEPSPHSTSNLSYKKGNSISSGANRLVSSTNLLLKINKKKKQNLLKKVLHSSLKLLSPGTYYLPAGEYIKFQIYWKNRENLKLSNVRGE